MWVRDTHPSKFVALVTKDINLRLKAKAVGMAAQDYLRDRVDDEAMMGIEKEVIVADANTDALQRLAYGQDNALPWQDVADKEPRPNQLYKFNFGGDTVCARYDAHRKEVVLVKTKEACGIRPRNDEQKFALDACLNPNLPLVSLTGGAGTGKTLIALAAALEQLLVYFVLRHLSDGIYDGRLYERAAFAVLSMRIICAVGVYAVSADERLDVPFLIEAARMYSLEIEYSDENIEGLLECLS